MVLFAKRVRAPKCPPNRASTSETPRERAEFFTMPNSSWQFARDKSASTELSGIGGAHLDVVKARGTGAVAGADHLFRLSLAAIRNAPEHPMIAIGDRRAGVPEFGGDAAVGRVLQHAHALAVFDFPRDLAAELEVIALVIDGPAAVGLHINGVRYAAEYLIQRLLTGLEADVGHAD